MNLVLPIALLVLVLICYPLPKAEGHGYGRKGSAGSGFRWNSGCQKDVRNEVKKLRKEVKSLAHDLEGVGDLKDSVKMLQDEVADREDDLSMLLEYVEFLENSTEDLSSELNDLKQIVADLESSTGGEERRVSFYARTNATNPFFEPDETVHFREELLDTENNFDSNTGMFTAPVAGVYFFMYSLMGDPISGNFELDLAIERNGEIMRLGGVLSAAEISTSSGSTLLELQAGDVVTAVCNAQNPDSCSVFPLNGKTCLTFGAFLV